MLDLRQDLSDVGHCSCNYSNSVVQWLDGTAPCRRFSEACAGRVSKYVGNSVHPRNFCTTALRNNNLTPRQMQYSDHHTCVINGSNYGTSRKTYGPMTHFLECGLSCYHINRLRGLPRAHTGSGLHSRLIPRPGEEGRDEKPYYCDRDTERRPRFILRERVNSRFSRSLDVG